MLILARHTDQRIMIGPDVVLTVVEIRGDIVRIGIDAPEGVPVNREEVHLRIAAEGPPSPKTPPPAGPRRAGR